MKLSVSLSDNDVHLLDDYVRTHAGSTRSSALREALQLLRERELSDQYELAFAEWDQSADSDLWDAVAGDGAR
ncbi:ribbon-helix-helix domain-containing protein [Cellulomonas sp. Leaf334]|uniref:ribbon-helix-helix domain-containing protein n=1 Tax=Cellulomonas sp. Leaf334 TaxID=1736339 RepID=UPI0007020634|nr:ribbon-helix-helix domain-containing protein [Cellulomonas sp. Leaf334]KQR11871.1 antitoxin [Cellulomonas sp. Leaf334]